MFGGVFALVAGGGDGDKRSGGRSDLAVRLLLAAAPVPVMLAPVQAFSLGLLPLLLPLLPRVLAWFAAFVLSFLEGGVRRRTLRAVPMVELALF